MMQPLFTFSLLVAVWIFTRIFYRLEDEWTGDFPARDWGHLRAIIILNHTSLYEPLLAGFADWRLLWLFSWHGVLPVAEKTMRRKIGVFFRFLVRHTVVVTRQRDHTWDRVLNTVDDRSIVIILPEGRMKRRDGLDSKGRSMTVRGGIADILEPLDEGRILLLHSGGFHHIQAPGESRLPKLFKTIRARLELLDLARYKQGILDSRADGDFRKGLIDDLTRRRDEHCPGLEDPSLKDTKSM
jgi:1-acyl-sn-glycerol-3-phosphate acyltransferase